VGEKNLNEIEQEIEQTRERLAATIDQLAYRTHPKTLATRQVNSVRNFFIDADGQPRQDNIIKVVGGVVGVVVALKLIRKVVG
jgi:hypothetical protein